MAIIMTLWIGNGAVLKSASQWQLKEFENKLFMVRIIKFSKFF